MAIVESTNIFRAVSDKKISGMVAYIGSVVLLYYPDEIRLSNKKVDRI